MKRGLEEEVLQAKLERRHILLSDREDHEFSLVLHFIMPRLVHTVNP